MIPTGYKFSQEGMEYFPLPNQYCPPVLHPMILMRSLPIFPAHQHLMGKIIGKNGHVFKNITHWSGCVYIYYQNGCIEIWGNYYSIDIAFHMLCQHIGFILNKHYYQEGFEHLPPDIRPIRVVRSQAIH